MSILNVWLACDHALVGVDTDSVDIAGNHYDCSKLLPIVHLNAVLAGRGSLALLGCAFVQMLVSGGEDFDVVAGRLPEYATNAFLGTIGGPLRSLSESAYQAGDEIVLVGWSPRFGRPRSVEVSRAPGASSFVFEETELQYVSPWKDSIDYATKASDVWQMRRLAGAQVSLLRRTDPEAAAGGRLVVAEIRKNGLSISNTGLI